MIRLLAVLCCGIFLVLLIAGQDRGQVRQGLLAKPAETVRTAVHAEEPALATPVIFVPAQPVRVAPPKPEPEPQVVAPAAADPEPTPEPPVAETWAYVDARSVNVRSGPSTSDAVIDRLTQGEAVLVVPQEAPVDGWTLVRIEGDGVLGYVADRFLTAQEP